MQEEALIIVSAKESSRKDAKTAKKTGGRGFAPLREMAQTKIKPEEEKSRFFSSSFFLLTSHRLLMEDFMIIDPHLHVWSDDENAYPFGPSQPKQPGSVELLLETMKMAGVDKAVIVQPIHYLFDNRYVADCLKRYPGVFAAQALADPTAPDAPDTLERLIVEQGFGGMRIHLSRYGDPAGLAAKDKDPLWALARDLNACFNLFGKAEDHAPIEPIIARFPDVKVVVDHIGNIPADEPEPRPLLANLLQWAQYPNVYVKISNVGQRSKEEYPHRDTFDMIRRIYDAYGPQRLMWGTDFPHVLTGTGYVESLDLIRKELFFTPDDLDWILCKTILNVWHF